SKTGLLRGGQRGPPDLRADAPFRRDSFGVENESRRQHWRRPTGSGECLWKTCGRSRRHFMTDSSGAHENPRTIHHGGPKPASKPDRDALFQTPRKRADDFEFGAKTAAVFDDMLDRSVPYYAEIQRMVSELAADFAQEGSAIYDLGCSTGTSILG